MKLQFPHAHALFEFHYQKGQNGHSHDLGPGQQQGAAYQQDAQNMELEQQKRSSLVLPFRAVRAFGPNSAARRCT